MLNRFRQIFSAERPRRAPFQPAVPDGQRVYAIGDVHGRLDLFEDLIALIEQDDSQRAPARTLIVLLGDLIDRGPDSAGVVAAARALARHRPTRALMGNHEEMFLRALDDSKALRVFLRIGGKQTVLSYGIDAATYRGAELDDLRTLLNERVPPEDLEYLSAMEDHIAIGDYLFVHAGIRPGVALEQQDTQDLRWIREPFLSHPERHQGCVIHGHTIRGAVEHWPSQRDAFRIGIDTGAYESDRLTVIGLQGRDRWFMDTAN